VLLCKRWEKASNLVQPNNGKRISNKPSQKRRSKTWNLTKYIKRFWNIIIKDMKVKVIIERGNDGSYGAYIGSDNAPFGIIGDGKSALEAKTDFLNSYEEMKVYYAETNKKFTEYEFEFQFDVASFLAYYGNILSLAGMERLTGVNQGQLSHYVTGHRKPSKKTIEKIEKKLHEFGKELNQVEFI
jgi:hypothetical protein